MVPLYGTVAVAEQSHSIRSALFQIISQFFDVMLKIKMTVKMFEH